MEFNPAIDYFISYTKVDKAWAEWIAWQLEEMGYEVFLKAWDIQAGQNFVLKINNVSARAGRTIAVLSDEYLSANVQSEWAAAYADDPIGEKSKLLPVKIKPVNLSGFLKSISAIDLIGLSKEKAKERLQEQIKASKDGMRNKPDAEPVFPGVKSEPSQAVKNQSQNTASHRTKANLTLLSKRNKLEDSPEFKAGLADKVKQAKHIFKYTGNEFYRTDKVQVKQSGFLLYGALSQWPDSLSNILYYEIKKQLQFHVQTSQEQRSPEPIKLGGRVLSDNLSPEDHLWELLAEKLTCPPQRKAIEFNLKDKKVPNILFRSLISDESSNPGLVCGMLEAWEQLEFPKHTPRHILILFYEHTTKQKSIWSFWGKKNDSLIDKINKILSEGDQAKSLLPEISSPTTKEIEDWIKNQFDPGEVQEVKDFVEDQIKSKYQHYKDDKKYARRVRKTKNGIEFHHHDLKSILIQALNKYG